MLWKKLVDSAIRGDVSCGGVRGRRLPCINICAVVRSVVLPQPRRSFVRRHSRTGCACLAALVLWWAALPVFWYDTFFASNVRVSKVDVLRLSFSTYSFSFHWIMGTTMELCKLVLDVIGTTRRTAVSRSDTRSHVWSKLHQNRKKETRNLWSTWLGFSA